MNRQATLLTALGAIVLVVVAYMFLIKPKMDEVTEIRAVTEDVRTQQSQVQSEITALEAIRSTSPEIEAELAAIGGIVPTSPSLPSTLRQLQMAGDESGVTLVSVAPGRPTSAGVAEVPQLSAIPLTLSLQGGYFQLVDFLRRVEDPAITARGILITGVTAAPEAYPTLTINVSAQMFSILDVPAPAAPAAPTTPTDEPTDGETDVEVEEDGA